MMKKQVVGVLNNFVKSVDLGCGLTSLCRDFGGGTLYRKSDIRNKFMNFAFNIQYI